jgi:hypothetical protein
MVTVFAVGIVSFQRDEGIGVRKTRDEWGGSYGGEKRVGGMR